MHQVLKAQAMRKLARPDRPTGQPRRRRWSPKPTHLVWTPIDLYRL